MSLINALHICGQLMHKQRMRSRLIEESEVFIWETIDEGNMIKRERYNRAILSWLHPAPI